MCVALIGASTNVLVSSIAAQQGIQAFSMFEFSSLGLVMAAAGLAYMFVIGIRLIPVLRLTCDTEKIEKLQQRLGVSLISQLGWRDQDVAGDEMELVEGVVAPNSPLLGETLKSLQFREAFGAKVLAIRQHHGQVAQEKLDSAALRAGDTLLLSVRKDRLEALARNPAFILVTPKAIKRSRRHKLLVAAAIRGAVVLSSALI